MKTYSHLEAAKRVPSDYEIVTSQLLSHPKNGIEVDAPFQAWYDRHQRKSPLQSSNWETFADPRRTTYTSYVELQSRREAFVAELFATAESSGYDLALSPEALSSFERIWGPARFAWHGLQMAASYLGQFAPSGKITIMSLFQAGDELRKIQGSAYRLRQLRREQTDSGKQAKDDWLRSPEWQPLRRAIETLLVTYDWGEAFVALNCCLKPRLDEFLLRRFGQRQRELGDFRMEEVCLSYLEDSRWHLEWTSGLRAALEKESQSNRDAVETWLTGWQPLAEEAVCSLGGLTK